jgi:hemolysin III
VLDYDSRMTGLLRFAEGTCALSLTETSIARSWWTRGRPFTLAELVADGIVHGVGLVVAAGLGTTILVLAASQTAPAELPAIALYVSALVLLLSVSLAFNLCPIHAPAKRLLARLDQAAIFLFIAATYTPFLALLGATPQSIAVAVLVWGGAIAGMTLKLVVPHRFGRGALVLYLGIGWSGVLIAKALSTHLPPLGFWLLIAGGVVYSAGVVFHLWEKLRFQNAVWHGFVVTGASLHLLALLDSVVLSRL